MPTILRLFAMNDGPAELAFRDGTLVCISTLDVNTSVLILFRSMASCLDHARSTEWANCLVESLRFGHHRTALYHTCYYCSLSSFEFIIAYYVICQPGHMSDVCLVTLVGSFARQKVLQPASRVVRQ